MREYSKVPDYSASPRRLGCLPFTWANRSVHSLSKWFAKFRTGEFRPGIAITISTISTDQLRPRRPETGIKDGFEEMDHESPFGIFHPDKQDYLFRCFVAPGNFPLGEPKKWWSIYFRTGFPVKFL